MELLGLTVWISYVPSGVRKREEVENLVASIPFLAPALCLLSLFSTTHLGYKDRKTLFKP